MLNYQELKAKISELEKQMELECKKFFQGEAQKHFAAHPDLKEFAWRQFTCYFADGDELYFSVYDPEINGVYDEDEVYAMICPQTGCGRSDYNYDDESKKMFCPLHGTELVSKVGSRTRHKELIKATDKFLRQISKEDYKKMFGDHVRIKVTPNGIDIEQYTDHH